jgi:hypothetical protein
MRALRTRRRVILGVPLTIAILLTVGCASTVPRQGTSGHVSWETVGETVVLRETAGVGVEFASFKYAVPISPTGGGREYFGGVGERTFLPRLESHGELRVPLPWATRNGGYAEYEFRGVDDKGHPVTIKVPLHLRRP